MSIVTEKTSKQASNDASPNYPPGGVPRTPLEFRLGPHPKKVSGCLSPTLKPYKLANGT